MDFIQNNLLLIGVAFASGAMLIWPFVRRTAGGPWVNTLQATQMINREDALLLDVREPAEYAKGHILGAKNVPLADLERRGLYTPTKNPGGIPLPGAAIMTGDELMRALDEDREDR